LKKVILVEAKKVFRHFSQLWKEMMTKWMYRFLNVGLAFFSATPVTQADKNVLS